MAAGCSVLRQWHSYATVMRSLSNALQSLPQDRGHQLKMARWPTSSRFKTTVVIMVVDLAVSMTDEAAAGAVAMTDAPLAVRVEAQVAREAAMTSLKGAAQQPLVGRHANSTTHPLVTVILTGLGQSARLLWTTSLG